MDSKWARVRREIPGCTKDLLLGWRLLPEVCAWLCDEVVDLCKAVRGVLGMSISVIIVLLMPLYFWLSPLMAWLTVLSDDRIEEQRRRLREDIHRNGRGE